MNAVGDLVDPRASDLVAGEFPLTRRDFRAIAAMLHEDAGISLPEGKAGLLYSRLAKRVRALGLPDFSQYCALIASAHGGEERGRMLAAMTTNVTRFFREPHHFEHLRGTVLPPLLEAARSGRRVRLWSAACSTGEEPYSVALSILDLAADAGQLDVRVLATDIDPNVLEKARAGRYSPSDLAPVPAMARQRWFARAADGRMEADDGLRRLVVFRSLNLIAHWPMTGRFDAILCRNVAIYFDEATQATIWSRFAALLPPGGHLYIGHSERLIGPAADMFDSVGVTTYRRRGVAP